VSLELFGHPFSSCTQKVLIALYADATDFQFRLLDQEHPENM
jgi:glutathione S-transferase